MQISKNSWHYRYVDWLWEVPIQETWNSEKMGFDRRVKLCPYMRRLTVCIAVAPFVGFFGAIAYPFYILWEWLHPKYWRWKEEREKREREAWLNRPVKKKEPNIFIEWLKAKEKKICPEMEIID